MVVTACATADESIIVRGINSAIKKSEGRFCCGGSLPLPPEGVRIWYSKEDESQDLLRLPVEPYDDASIEALIAASADEGLVHEFVPPSFATNFDLGQYFILDEIHRLLAPGAVLRAQLHRLTVIESGGLLEGSGNVSDKEEGEFGFLVIGLPCNYTGGDMEVKNGSIRSQVFSWGVEALESIHWAAFMSDCEHKITEVTSGYRLTLTYKLYRLADNKKRKRVLGVNDTLVDAHSLPLYELLCEAKNCASFYSNGRILGFACQQLYALNTSSEKLKYKDVHKDEKTWLLKGADAMLFAAAKAAGLKVELRPIYRNSSEDNPALLYVGKIVGEKPPSFLGEYRKDFDGLDIDTLGVEELPTMRDGVKTDAEISWCLKNFGWVTGKESGYYVEVDVPWYYATALLVTIPPWSERQELTANNNNDIDTPSSKKNKIMEDAIAYWFRKAEEQVNREIDYDYRAEEDEAAEEDMDDDDDEEDYGDESEDEDEDGHEEDGGEDARNGTHAVNEIKENGSGEGDDEENAEGKENQEQPAETKQN